MTIKIFNSSAIMLAKRENDMLTITFTSGGKYKYDNIPAEVIDGLWNAESAGQFYHKNIRGKYDATKLA